MQKRSDGRTELLFALNFTREAKRLELPDAGWRDAVEGEPVAGELTLPGLGSRVLR